VVGFDTEGLVGVVDVKLVADALLCSTFCCCVAVTTVVVGDGELGVGFDTAGLDGVVVDVKLVADTLLGITFC
jgi:hypothetical protein